MTTPGILPALQQKVEVPTVKNRDLLDSVESINALAALKQPVRAAFSVALNLKAIKDHLTLFEEQRKKLVEQHTQKGEDGKPILVYAPENGPDGKPLLGADGSATMVKDADGKIINKVLDGQVKLVGGGKPFQKDMADLLDVDVTEDLHIRKIKLSDLKGDIESQTLVGVIWMINDDSDTAK